MYDSVRTRLGANFRQLKKSLKDPIIKKEKEVEITPPLNQHPVDIEETREANIARNQRIFDLLKISELTSPAPTASPGAQPTPVVTKSPRKRKLAKPAREEEPEEPVDESPVPLSFRSHRVMAPIIASQMAPAAAPVGVKIFY